MLSSGKMLVATLLVCGFVAGPSTPSRAKTGNELLSDCENFMRTSQQNGQRVTLPNAFAASCWGFFEAVHGFAFLTLVDEAGVPEKEPLLRACPPKGVSVTQMVRIYLEYAKRNPQRLHESAIFPVMTALIQAFPCQNR